MWIPGHSDIEGNEKADREAKKAALDPTLRWSYKYKPLKSGRTRHIKTAAKQQWHKEWHKPNTAKPLRHIMRTQNKRIKTGTGLYNEIPNRHTMSTISQLRTGHCELNLHRHRFGHVKSPYCKCGYGKENVEHYLLEFKNYKEQRKNLRHDIGAGRSRSHICSATPHWSSIQIGS